MFDRVCRNPDTGDVAIAQRPNLPLSAFLASLALRLAFHPQGALGAAVSIVGTLSLVVWAVLEVTRGDSLFRRVLGTVVLVSLAVNVLR
jgi:hypothetical protein